MKKYLALLAGLFLLVSCNNDEPVAPTPPVADFTVTMTEIGTRTATAHIVPGDVSKPYLAVILPKSTYDEDYGGSAKLFAKTVIETYSTEPLVLTDMLKVGTTDVFEYSLTPLTDNVVFVFGCSTDGKITIEPKVHVFKTIAGDQPSVDCTFDIEISDIKTSGAMFTIKPSVKDVMYAVFPGDKASLEAVNNDLLMLAQNTVAFVESEGQVDFSNFDSATNLQMGDSKFRANTLRGNTNQIVICFVTNKYGEVLSAVACENFRTLKPEPSGCTFELAIDNLTFNSVNGTVKPSSAYQEYYGAFATKAILDEQGGPDGFMDYMTLGKGLVFPTSGPVLEVSERGALEPEMDYLLFAFTSEAAWPTSELFSLEFKSQPLNYKAGGKAAVNQFIVSIEDGALYMYNGYGIILLKYEPNEFTKEYFIATPAPEELTKWDQWDVETSDDLRKAIALFPGSTDHRNDFYKCFWPLGSTMDFYVMGIDEDGFFGVPNKMTKRIVLGAPVSPELSSVAPDVSGVTRVINNRLTDSQVLVGSDTKLNYLLKR